MRRTAGSSQRSRARKQAAKVGTFSYRVELAAHAEGPYIPVDALVDTGSFYTRVPGRVLRELGLEPTDRVKFQMANGRPLWREAAEVLIRIDGRVRHTVCVFGEDGDLTLLGAYTLEGFALAADPVNKRLVPIPMLPVAAVTSRD